MQSRKLTLYTNINCTPEHDSISYGIDRTIDLSDDHITN
jgi:hypothetical protein